MNRARYQKYISWYSDLPDQERSRLDNICNNILSMVPQCLEDLNGETLIRKRADMPESRQVFYKEELKRAVDQAMKLLLSDQKELYTLLDFIFYEIESGEINLSELYSIPGGNINAPKEPLGPKSYKWIESTVEVLSYLLYAVQIKALICEGIFEGTRRESEPPKETSNEILYLLTRQVIKSMGGMDESLHGRIHTHPEGEKLRLSDVLVESVTASKVQDLYKVFLASDRPSSKWLQLFLRLLVIRGYYSCKLTNKDIEAIARNDFDRRFNYNNTKNRTLPEVLNIPPFNKIPPIK